MRVKPSVEVERAIEFFIDNSFPPEKAWEKTREARKNHLLQIMELNRQNLLDTLVVKLREYPDGLLLQRDWVIDLIQNLRKGGKND